MPLGDLRYPYILCWAYSRGFSCELHTNSISFTISLRFFVGILEHGTAYGTKKGANFKGFTAEQNCMLTVC